MVTESQVNKFNRLTNRFNNRHRDRNDSSAQTTSSGNQVQDTYSTNNGNSQSQCSNNTNKWVVNLSKTPLTQSKGPNFAIDLNNPPNVDFITAIELVCHKLSDQDLQELTGETNCLLRKARALRANITRGEKKVLRELKEDKDRVVLTADKGVPW